VRRKDQEFLAFGVFFDERQHFLREAARAMKHHEKRHRPIRIESGRNVEHGVALIGDAEPVAARRQRAFDRIGGSEGESAEERRIENWGPDWSPLKR
jgi:hypothetical protein